MPRHLPDSATNRLQLPGSLLEQDYTLQDFGNLVALSLIFIRRAADNRHEKARTKTIHGRPVFNSISNEICICVFRLKEHDSDAPGLVVVSYRIFEQFAEIVLKTKVDPLVSNGCAQAVIHFVKVVVFVQRQ